MNHFKKLALLFAFSLIITACASAPAKKSFILTTDTNNIVAGNAQLPSLMISQVRSTHRLSTDMFYSRSKNEVEIFTKSDWVSPPTQMLQAAIAQDLNAKNIFQYVIIAPNSISTQYRLDITMTEMNQFFNDKNNQSYVVLRLQARLINNSNNRIVKSFSFNQTESSETYNAEGGVAAYNRALQTIIDQLTQNLIQTLHH